LLPGANTVLISATDNDSNTSTKTVTINYTENNIWSIPYDVDWSSLNNDITKVNEFTHVVDGKFILTPNGIRTAEPGYDRLIALGDVTSTNYEVLVPITIHSMPGGGGVGVLLRWKGHTDTPVSCQQPKCGYEPHGAISWFRSNKLEFYQGNNQSFTPVIGVTYMFRTSVETETTTGNTNYRIKFWEQGSPEPVAWNIEQTEDASNLQEGSLMLISHQADVTFGNVTVTPGSLSISNVQTQLSNNNTEATVTWTTNQPTSSRIDFGPTVAYEDGFVEDTNLVTSHSINLTGLTADTIYQYKISGESSSLETVEKTGLVLSTFTSGIKSDDFCGNTLDSVWTFNNPLSDCSYSLTGSGTDDAFLEISVPGGSEHQIYSTNGIQAPNLMQSINNSDFEVEVKFESEVIAPQYQQQGILVKESNDRFLRFEFYSRNPDDTYLYAQAFDLPAAQAAFVNARITSEDIAPLYMRVKREGNQWTLSYSFDGTNFTEGTSFFNDMVPTQIGPYAGNAVGSSSPAHTAKIDYFLNLADPITSEDGCNAQQSPVLSAIGDQSVQEGSSLQLTLTATDADGNDSDIDFTQIDLPSFASLTDNDDGTATLDINPLLGDVGNYTMTIVVTDFDGLTDEEEFDIEVTSLNPVISNLVSDDFCDNVLNPIWTFNDPLPDGVGPFEAGNYALTGSGTSDALLEITVPGDTSHEMWTSGIKAPHVVQASNNSDFEIEVKMESSVNVPQFAEQGILIKQDDNHFLRFEFYSTTANTNILAAILEPGATIVVNSAIGVVDIAPLYMRVKREGDEWTQSYSFDGVTWVSTGSFTHVMTVSGVGLYSGNSDSNPAHTAKFDYFKNLADPILNEDSCIAQQPPVLAAIGDQSVEVDSSLQITLTATDADGNDSDIDFTQIDLPGFASLTDNNDGTATLDINPLVGDEGSYTMTIVVTDLDGLSDEEEFDILVTLISNLVSDDFCDNALNPIWTFNNPIADGGNYTLTGSGTDDALLEISVPGGTEHQLWTGGIKAPHIIQASNNGSFELEVKMESPVNAPQYQQQGILIKQDENNFLRFEMFSDNNNTRMLSAILEEGAGPLLDSNIPYNISLGALDISPIYMRVKRQGNEWTQSYSLDGQTWTVVGNAFNHGMVVTGVGLYSGNGIGSSSPAHTAKFDYFKNLKDPIANEDSCATLSSEEPELVNTLSVYPNPVDEILNIDIAQNSTYVLIDMMGKVLVSGNLTAGKNELQLGNYESGLYFLKIGNSSNIFIKKIVIN
jgi:regulation of enolase protein 1 (concanavalin A-like superfamily)